jgi:broad specificity phosphatase PhoE
MAQLYLVRHGQASFGAADYDKLSDIGHKQSLLLGQYFAQRDIAFDSVVTGDMLRHKETAAGIQKGSERAIPVVIDSGWNEFDFNAVVSAFLRVNHSMRPAEDAPRAEFYRLLKNAMFAWSKQEIGNDLPESWGEFTGRVAGAVDRICASDAKNVLVASSGGAIAITMMNMLGLTVDKTVNFNLQIKNTSINHFFFNRDGIQLSSFNNVGHLDLPEHKSLITYS